MWYIGQILTFVSYFIFWMSIFRKKKTDILSMDIVSRIIAIVGFLFLGTYDGIKNTLYVLVRGFVGKVTNEKKLHIKIVSFIIMASVYISMYIFDWHGISSICLIGCGLLNLFGVILCKPQGLRIAGLIGSPFYFVFHLASHNYLGAICEVVTFIMLILSYIKNFKAENITIEHEFNK